uniref:Candidate secreted effector n=1 Tax=Meloidogyne incognita TaxID=6306 RepID=A0A914LVW0_MELIC
MPSKHLIGRNIKNNIVNNVKQDGIEEKNVLTTENSNDYLQNDKIININIQSTPQISSEPEQNPKNFTKNIEEEKTKSLERKEENENIQTNIVRSIKSSEKIQEFEKLKSTQEIQQQQQGEIIKKENSEIMPPQTNKQSLSKQGLSNNKRINNNTSSLITPSSSTRKYSSSLQQKSPSNKLNNSTIPCPTQMSSSNTSTILSPPDSAELNISQCSNVSTENNKTKLRKQCFSMPTSATQSMVASTSTASASLRSSLLSGNDRPKSLLPLQSSKLIRPSNIGRTTNKNTKQNEKQQANILTNSGGKPLMSRISTKSGYSATNSPQNNNTEKKPVLAVKGVSVLSTTPATQRRRPSNSNCSTNIVSPSTDQNISADSSLVEQQKRNKENVAVGVTERWTMLKQ